MQLGNRIKVIPVYFDPKETCTLLAGSEFDDGKWHMLLKDGIRFMHEDVEKAHFPREIKADQPLSNDFLSSLGPRVNGQRKHSQFPLPDSVFVRPKRNSCNTAKQSAINSHSGPVNPEAKESKASEIAEEKGKVKPSEAAHDEISEALQWMKHLDIRQKRNKVILSSFREVRAAHDVHHRSWETTCLLHEWTS